METKDGPVGSQVAAQSANEREINELKHKISQMNDLCQQFKSYVDCLESKIKHYETRAKDLQTETNFGGTSTNYNEVDALKEKVKELVTMNVNWQKFNSQREQHVHELNGTIAQLERQLEAVKTSGAGQLLPESQQIEFDKLLLAKKHRCDSLEEEKLRIEDENHHLKRKMDQLERQVADQKKELDDLREHKQLLEAQLVMFEEDFKTERLDRERAQSKIAELEIQVSELQKHQKALYQSSWSNRTPHYSPIEGTIIATPSDDEVSLTGRGLYQTDRSATFSRSPESSVTKNYEGANGNHRNGLSRHGVNLYQTDGIDESDAVVVLTEDSPSCRREMDDVLCCPNCHKVFTKDHHLDLLEHMEDCD